MDIIDILDGLNPAQRQAVESIEGPLLILAGPGSGKTRVITQRIAYLIKVCGMRPWRIMAVTFTNKAANEMRERLERLLGHAAEDLTLGTFHAICARILRQEGKVIGLDSGFVIYDDSDQQSLVKRSIQDVGLDPKQYAPRALQSAISMAKSQLLTPYDYGLRSRSYFEEVVQRVYERYQQLLIQNKALDFDDLLMKVVYLFQERSQVLSKYQSRYLHILVDEFQDTNIAQYALTRQLAGKHHNICVVGDPDQSIYTWRSADLRNILSFEKDYPDAKVIILEQSYRSTKTILEVADNIVSANVQRKPKNLWTENELGEPVTIVEPYNEEEEARFVVNEVEHLLSRGLARLQDCAVMYRVNAQSRILEETFIRYGVPYRLVGATRFYERREIKDVIAYLRLIHNPYDSVSLSRIINVPGRGIGQRTIDELSRWAKAKDTSVYSALQMIAEAKEPSSIPPRSQQALARFFALISDLIEQSRKLDLIDLFDLVLKRSGYKEHVQHEENGEERWENIRELRTVAQGYRHLLPAEGLGAFLEGIALVSDVDNLDGRADATTLITLHQAKGLEFPVVFIVGMEEGLLPHSKSLDDPAQMEEERRLCYVGVTRAAKRLYLLHASQRKFLGGSSRNVPSRFFKDIPHHLTETRGHWEESRPAAVLTARNTLSWERAEPAAVLTSRKLPDLEAGDRVRHTKFGEGTVVSCLVTGNDQEVTIGFDKVGRKRLLLSLAPLEKLE